ncbi:nuclear-pore anchor-like isoform X2 [Leguminivora glycinivorella]|uniref:nuclear-pore anchor-like isoform X2 n=1 Tax=Leguminivora glycinivorella TaxID=1035111 RepID=UPI00200D0180|nr:nuclear-pore anchor-like isoform X2 [Leguminivora glycinivorella]
MDLDRDTSNTDECLETALQIFDFCGAKSTGTLHVGALMDKFAPSVKTNNAEFSYLKTLLDPNQSNPEISVPQLASALNAFTDSQKTKLDLDESFNLKSGMGPQDSDSGISNDGYVILEELQAELREKTHLATKLRGQLDFADRQHEEALAALSAERDSLRSHLNMLREENMTLTHERRDYEEACERLCSSEQALALAKRERDTAQRRATTALEQAATLEAEKLTLQELLSKSKEECHRINEMYASRQASLLEQNELLKRERAELATRLQDQEDLVQQMLKEKVILEMELKDVLNRSNQTQLRLDRSIDVSYTEDQMLTALDSLNVDSRFSPDVASVGTQAEVPCAACETRTAVAPQRSIRRLLWESLKCLFQAFAVLCFIFALSSLYGVTRRRGCGERELPWRWLDAQEFMDLLLRIEYVADVPM